MSQHSSRAQSVLRCLRRIWPDQRIYGAVVHDLAAQSGRRVSAQEAAFYLELLTETEKGENPHD